MSQAITIAVATAVRELLAEQVFEREATAERVYDWEARLEDLRADATARLLVVPGGIEGEWSSRCDVEETVVIDVGVAAKLQTLASDEIDGLVRLVEEVQQFLLATEGGVRHLDTDPDAVCIEAKILPIYSPTHLHQARVFLGVIHTTFQVIREV